jgi:integrase
VSWQISRFKTFEPTKGKDSRYVPFSEHLNDELVPLLKGAPLSSRTLFTSEKGTPVDHDNFVKRVFKKDCMEAKVTTIRFHDLRHTALTMMVKKGVLLPVIQKIAGHKKIKTTMRYVHVVAKDIEEVGQKFSLMSSFSNKENGRLKLV